MSLLEWFNSEKKQQREHKVAQKKGKSMYLEGSKICKGIGWHSL